MKNRFLPILLATVMILAGCSNTAATATTVSKAATAETTPAETTTVAPEPTAEPVSGKETFFFTNYQQYNRLYQMDVDGKNLALFVDEDSYCVTKTESTVYFMDRYGALCAVDIATRTRTELLKSIHSYHVNDEWLFYAVDGTMDGITDTFYDEWHVRNLATGEDKVILTCERSGDCIAYGDNIYFVSNDWESNTYSYSRYNAPRDVMETIAAEVNDYWNQPIANKDGLYFCVEENPDADVYLRTWYFVAKNSAQSQVIDALTQVNASHLFFADENGYLYSLFTSGMKDDRYYSYSDLYYAAKNGGENQLLLSTDQNSSNYVSGFLLPGLEQDRVLICVDNSANWPGDPDVFDTYYEYSQYYLFSPDKVQLLSLDVRGEESLMFADGDFPQLNSGTARKPVTAALYALFVASNGYEGAMPKSSKTHGAWLAIADKEADVILVPMPTQEEQDYLEEKGVAIEKKLYGGDGLVFIGNKENPVNDLTHEQILGIYRGEITNWKELGGPDKPISVYFRNDQSGSQRMFEKLVFSNKDVPDFENMDSFGIMDDMSSIVDICATDPYAVGYSIMTYLHSVYSRENLKVFSVDGVEPSAASLRDSSYRYGVPEYLVIRADEAENSPARRLYNWFGSSISDDLLLRAEMTPIHD